MISGFGVAGFVRAGWAKAGPPGPWWGPILGLLGLTGLALVGVHFLAPAPVFGQPVLYLAAVLLTAIAVLAALVPGTMADRSFWCGVLGAPVFPAIGGWATVAATTVFRHI